ncbi:conserved hypothetical protein [Acinetobacter proteolyticus]|uniref:Uncharacterized protein n=1 Tax=Acinetobacter proteolyticus TaxID=1776741 RepID=A0A653K1U7_9GAMM|nr:hypothetical protein [Acinetobacter proteolyticus]VXA54694.1 conserved hypothetical protein [Acinetobacter proteolyticus]
MIKNPLNQLIQHEKRIAIQQSIFKKYENLSDEAKDVVRLAMRYQIERSSMTLRFIYAQPEVEKIVNENLQHKKTIELLNQQITDLLDQNQLKNTSVIIGKVPTEEVKNQIQSLMENPSQIVPDYGLGTLEEVKHTGFLVKNSHTFWKWLSTWAFAAIGYVSVYGVPPEIIALVPEASQNKVTAALALLGFVGRFINQSRGK